jgi:crossover junction endodeoxyribonuclease RuvC
VARSQLRVPSGDGRTPVDRPIRVVGIDPGLNVTGYAVVEPAPGLAAGARIIEAGIIRTHRATEDLGTRLGAIHQGVLEVLEAFPPTAMALEQVHTHLKRPRTAVLMAHARGVILLAAQLRNVPVYGYAAARIKKTLTGSGRAPKDQIQRAIQTELKLRDLPEPHDVADACAVALCHLLTARLRAALGDL